MSGWEMLITEPDPDDGMRALVVSLDGVSAGCLSLDNQGMRTAYELLAAILVEERDLGNDVGTRATITDVEL